MGAKVEFDPGLSAPELARAIDETEASVAPVVPEARMMYLEPDVHDPGTLGSNLGRATRGARRTAGLRGWPPPPTLEPDLGNASGGSDMSACVIVIGGEPPHPAVRRSCPPKPG